MRRLATLAGKDLTLLFRDRIGLFFVIVFPLVMALLSGAVFGGAGSKKPTNIPVGFIDNDASDLSRRYIETIEKTESVSVRNCSLEAAKEAVRKGRLAAFVKLPKGFGERLGRFWEVPPEIVLGIDPSKRVQAGMLEGILTKAWFEVLIGSFKDTGRTRKYVQEASKAVGEDESIPNAQKATLQAFLSSLDKVLGGIDYSGIKGGMPLPGANVTRVNVMREGKGPSSAFAVSFPSGMLWAIIGCVVGFAQTIVRERTEGTMIRLRVAPLSLGEILAGKALACFIMCSGVVLVLLLISLLPVFNVHISDPYKLLMAIISTSLCFVGIMMLISVSGRTEQAVAGAGWGILLFMCMFGGCMIPLFIMPKWMIAISNFSPVKWGIYALEGAIWRDFSYREMLTPCTILVGVGVITFSVGVSLFARREG